MGRVSGGVVRAGGGNNIYDVISIDSFTHEKLFRSCFPLESQLTRRCFECKMKLMTLTTMSVMLMMLMSIDMVESNYCVNCDTFLTCLIVCRNGYNKLDRSDRVSTYNIRTQQPLSRWTPFADIINRLRF